MLKRSPLGIRIHKTVRLNSTERHIRPGSCLYEPHTHVSFFPNGWQICQDWLPMARPSHSSRGHEDVPPTRPSGTKAPAALASSENGRGWRLTKHPAPGIALSQSELTHRGAVPSRKQITSIWGHKDLDPPPQLRTPRKGHLGSRALCRMSRRVCGSVPPSAWSCFSPSPRRHSQELNGTNTVSLQISSESASRSLT